MSAYRGNKKERAALSTFVKLIRATESLSANVHNPLREFGLTVSQFGVLEALYHLGPMCQKDIAKKILKTTGNLTTVIVNLEKRGLIIRERAAEDRRYYQIALTGKGRKTIADLFPGHASRMTYLMGALTLDEQKELGRLCKKLSGRR
ncbi:MAG: MarR family transcriptional regulator [Thermodesulfobacteriota bacterium]